SEDAAALAIGSSLKVDVSSLRAAQINVSQGVSMLQIADGSLGKVQDVLVRMKSIALTSSSGQLSDLERSYVDAEYQLLLEEADRIIETTIFNDNQLLGGTNQVALDGATLGTAIDSDNGFVGYAFESFVNPGDTFDIQFFEATDTLTVTNTVTSEVQSLTVSAPQVGQIQDYSFHNLGVTLTLNSDFDDTTDIASGVNTTFASVATGVATGATLEYQVGKGTTAAERINVTLPVINTGSLGLAGTDLLTDGNAGAVLDQIDVANNVIIEARANIGANQSRLEFAAGNIAVAKENSEAARSVLLDVDVAEEITKLASSQALLETGMNMLSRANQSPDLLVDLLRNS
ncbi:MAG: flagellin, partial [Alphaproteobacteria bacterium]|nr:flagellin [Alphaproteobacteria bacterium]